MIRLFTLTFMLKLTEAEVYTVKRIIRTQSCSPLMDLSIEKDLKPYNSFMIFNAKPSVDND